MFDDPTGSLHKKETGDVVARMSRPKEEKSSEEKKGRRARTHTRYDSNRLVSWVGKDRLERNDQPRWSAEVAEKRVKRVKE